MGRKTEDVENSTHYRVIFVTISKPRVIVNNNVCGKNYLPDIL